LIASAREGRRTYEFRPSSSSLDSLTLLGARGDLLSPSRDRQVSEPKPWVGVSAPAEILIESVLDTSRSARVANLVAQLPEVLRLAGSGVFGAWYRGVMYLGTTTLNARWTSKWGPRQVASGSPDVEEIAERLQSLINH
jgi:hypothetical protein